MTAEGNSRQQRRGHGSSSCPLDTPPVRVGKAQSVRYLVIWVPQGLRTEEVRAVLTMPEMSGRRGGAG